MKFHLTFPSPFQWKLAQIPFLSLSLAALRRTRLRVLSKPLFAFSLTLVRRDAESPLASWLVRWVPWQAYKRPAGSEESTILLAATSVARPYRRILPAPNRSPELYKNPSNKTTHDHRIFSPLFFSISFHHAFETAGEGQLKDEIRRRMPRFAEVKRRRNALRRGRFAGLRGINRKPPLPSGRPDPRNFETVDPDTYFFPKYFTAEYLQATHPWEEVASPHRQKGSGSTHLPSTTLPADSKPGPPQVAPAPCTTCPTAGPQAPLDEEELILSSLRNKLILRRPPPLPFTQVQQFDQEILHLRGLPAK